MFGRDKEKADVIETLPMVPLRDVVVFPHMVIPLFVGRPKSIKALEAAMEQGKSIMLAAQKAAAKDEPSPSDIYEIGCVANILQMLKLPDGTVKVLVEGATRAKVLKYTDRQDYYEARRDILNTVKFCRRVWRRFLRTSAPVVERSAERRLEHPQALERGLQHQLVWMGLRVQCHACTHGRDDSETEGTRHQVGNARRSLVQHLR